MAITQYKRQVKMITTERRIGGVEKKQFLLS